MPTKILSFVLIFVLFSFIITNPVFAIPRGVECNPNDSLPNNNCNSNLFCQRLTTNRNRGTCENFLAQGAVCDPNDTVPNSGCDKGKNLFCKPLTADPNKGTCEQFYARGVECNPNDSLPNHGCDSNLTCQPLNTNPNRGTCEKNAIRDVFGTIQPPPVIAAFLANNRTGSGAISEFLSRLIVLIYSIAGIVLLFMILWGAFDWMTSGGDKEKVAGAQRKIISALIGIILFALAFALIRILGEFTGFTFFKG